MQVVLLWLILIFFISSLSSFFSFGCDWPFFFFFLFSFWRRSTWMTRQRRWWARVSLVMTRMNDSTAEAEAEGRSKGHSCGREMERDKRGRRMERVDSSQTGKTICWFHSYWMEERERKTLGGGEEWSWREVACSTWQDCAWNPCRKSKLSFLLLHPLS